MQKHKIIASLLGGVSMVPILTACVTLHPEYEICDDTVTPNDCPTDTPPVEVEK